MVISDTGPLRYLCELQVVDVLPILYDRITTTPIILAELQQPNFPEAVRRWAAHPPAWLEVESPAEVRFLDRLDDGEASAISLAIERKADALLIDERFGTHVAQAEGLRTFGTLAVLIDAGLAKQIDFHDALDRLTHHTLFRSTPQLIEQVVAEYELRLQQQLRSRIP